MILTANKMQTVLSFGELLLRMIPDSRGEWLKENKLPFFTGGAELNVANALALWGVPSAYLTAMPDNELSHQIADSLKDKNIEISNVIYKGDRLGIYYLTKGNDIKHNALIYDRTGSSFSQLEKGTIDWDCVFEDVSWVHFSAICPAVNENVAEVCLEMLEAASQKKIIVSVDLNYRARLWQYDKQPVEIMPDLVRYCDLIMGNIWAAEKMLGIGLVEDITVNKKEIYLAQAKETSKAIMTQYPRCKAVANTFRFDNGDDLKYYATLYTGGDLQVAKEYTSTEIVDKVGSGDCFMAGLIYGFYTGMATEQILEFATAAAFEKLFTYGDATNTSAQLIKQKAGLTLNAINP